MRPFGPASGFGGAHRAHDVTTIMGQAHHAIKMAMGDDRPRPSRQVQKRIIDLLKAIEFFPMYLDGMSMSGRDRALDEAAQAIAALSAAVDCNNRTIAGRFAQWLHFRRYPHEYTRLTIEPTRFGKGVGSVIPKLLTLGIPFEIVDRKAKPDTLH